MKFNYDIIVVGGGHAGCEAALAAAKMGAKTMLITMDMSKVAAMSCNPAIGGVAKGQIVREIDALGGQMGLITDLSTIQFRMLNRSKGAAMWSPRAQCDKYRYCTEWRATLDGADNLSQWQDNVSRLIVSEGRVVGVETQMGSSFYADAVILTNGTFLDGLMHVGLQQSPGGRAGDAASHGLSGQLRELGFEVDRMKTGTPVRLDSRSIDFSKLEIQHGDAVPEKFSYLNSSQAIAVDQQMPCYLVYTSAEVHDILRTGFDRSPLFTGVIRGIGPRYCPSIEDKLRTFADKQEHQLFLEPEGRTTNEYYLNGFSSSLPLEVQVEALNHIQGLEEAQIYRPGYAIEYDFFPPTQLRHTLETKQIENLYFAGQINGTTGYEEAAAQGLMAGINAVRKIRGLHEVILGRDQAYIGVLIDDLVTKGVDEPYRMFTSRAEYRILLRQDNADCRLTRLGHEIGLASDGRLAELDAKEEKIALLTRYFSRESVAPEELASFFETLGESNITQKRKLSDILIRNGVTISKLADHIERLRDYIVEIGADEQVCQAVEITSKYSGYIERERLTAEKFRRLEDVRIRSDFDYSALSSISIEARQKLTKIRPTTIAQASRIPGVSPADINILLVFFGR